MKDALWGGRGGRNAVPWRSPPWWRRGPRGDRWRDRPPREFAKTLTEKQLRVHETKVYGRRHAADHARARLGQRRIAVRAKRGLAPRRVPKGVLRALAIGTPDQVGVWEKPSAIPVFAINAVLLVTGKVLFHSYVPQQGGLDDPAVAKQSRAVVWDPATKTVVKVEPRDQDGVPVNVWCSGQTVLPDGRVVIVGGNIPNRTSDFDSPDFKGESRIFTFNPYTYKWIDQGRMAHGRWYPGVVALPDGRVLITSGRDEVATATRTRTSGLHAVQGHGRQGHDPKVGREGPRPLPARLGHAGRQGVHRGPEQPDRLLRPGDGLSVGAAQSGDD